MRQPPKRPGIARVSETTEQRETIRTIPQDIKGPDLGHFCSSCTKWYSYLKDKRLCHACTAHADRLKSVYGAEE